MNTSSERKGLLSFLGGMSELFQHPGKGGRPVPGPAEDKFEEARVELQEALLDLKESIEKKREVRKSAVTGKINVATLEEQEKDLAIVHQKMRSAITELHQKLGTGISDSELNELRGFLQEVLGLMSGSGGVGLDERLRTSVLARVYEETGLLAWECLLELMARSKMSWPDPSGLIPSSAPEEVEIARQHQLVEIKGLFLESKVEAMAALVVGEVKVWKAHHYPKPDSTLWKKVALRGVGAGLRARLMKIAVERLRRDSDMLKGQVQNMFKKELEVVRGVLQTGIESMGQADEVIAGAMKLFDEVVPDLAWEHVESLVHEEAAPLTGKTAAQG